MKIGIMGFQGVGKTETAQRLAQALKIPHVDLDSLFEESPKDMVRKYGLAAFREAEKNISLDYDSVVLAFGGGALASIQKAHQLGYSLVYLYRPFEEMITSQKPIGGTHLELWNERHPIFSACAHHTLYARKETLIEELLAIYGK